MPGTGGGPSGSGGQVTATGGSVLVTTTGTGGRAPGSGGAVSGSGGTSASAGGSVGGAGGSAQPGAGGTASGSGGRTVGASGGSGGTPGDAADAAADRPADTLDVQATTDSPADLPTNRDLPADLVDGPGPPDGPAGDSGRRRYAGLPQPMCVWNEAYQQTYAADTVAEILAGARSCYVLVDPFSSTEARAAIASMQQASNTVSCYISVGTCEDWRDDYAAMKPFCVTTQWGDWPGEYFVDRTDSGLVALMEARIDKMASWGCDMVEFDNMDWAFDAATRSQYGITATAAQAEAYNETLCAYAHGRGMGCMAKSSAQGATDFDGLTVESSQGDMDWWTPADMQGMLSSSKIGIVVHYDETDCAAILAHYQSEYGAKLSFICEDRALKKYRHFP